MFGFARETRVIISAHNFVWQHLIWHQVRRIVAKTIMAPLSVIKELQRLVAIIAMSKVFQGPDMKKVQQESKLYEIVHGNPNDENSVSEIELMINGIGVYAFLYDIEPIQNNAEGNEGRADQNVRVLKESVHRQPNTRIVVGTNLHAQVRMAATLLENTFSSHLIPPSCLGRRFVVRLVLGIPSSLVVRSTTKPRLI